jgi:hypothetical protein
MNKVTQAFVIAASTAVIAGSGAWFYKEYATEKARKDAVEACIRVKTEVADQTGFWLTEEIRTDQSLKRAWFRAGCERDTKNWKLGDGRYQSGS